MDQNRLFLAIVISIGILIGFEFLMPTQPVRKLVQAPIGAIATPDAGDAEADDVNVPRLPISASRVQGSIALVGAKFDDLVLRDYHETVAENSPQVRILDVDTGKQASYVQFGWLSDSPGVVVPDSTTLWQSDSKQLTSGAPATLSWDNGQGLIFKIKLTIDDNFMFSVVQSVHNNGTKPVVLRPWSRIRRGYTPVVTSSYGSKPEMLGVFGNQLHEMDYKSAKSAAAKTGGIAYEVDTSGGWSGITDKYWLTSLIPDQTTPGTTRFRHLDLKTGDGWQVDFAATNGQTLAPGGDVQFASDAFVGAKEVKLLDRYQAADGIPSFDKAVDFGWFYFISKPIFFALDWFNSKLGNFGLAIMAFTVVVKLLFFPLANRSYRSMNKMRQLAPKMQLIRERFKDDPTQMQSETMALYKTEKVNPASGCLPMLIQIPVFIALNKDLNVSIEMRHAPFYGWIHDLSAQDPTNLFNLFGLLPFDPTALLPALHLGLWPIIMGLLMYVQQRLSPQVPDPVQARMMRFMPLIFTFMMGQASAGLVIYWSWNNLLSLGQQWLITRQSRVSAPAPQKS